MCSSYILVPICVSIRLKIVGLGLMVSGYIFPFVNSDDELKNIEI